ncbi:MAG: hypothetical protein ACREJX_13915 [Polyangiaceae bacterium]
MFPKQGVPLAHVTQDDGKATIRVSHVCSGDQVDFQTIERKSIVESYNRTPQNDWWLGAAGVVLAGIGATMVATPDSFASSDQSTSNAISSKEARGGGVVFLSLGMVALGIVGVDLIRASHEEQTTTRTRERAGLRASDVACAEIPYVGAHVFGVFRDRQIDLGESGPDASLSIDQTSLVPEATILGATTDGMQLVVDSHPVATLSLKYVIDRFDERRWHAIDPEDLHACAEEASAARCASLRAYVNAFPSGTHIDEARDAIHKYQAALDEQERLRNEALEKEREREQAAADLRAREERVRIEKAEHDAAVKAAAEEREAAAAEKRREAAKRASNARAECVSKCAETCNGDKECRSQCVQQQCH